MKTNRLDVRRGETRRAGKFLTGPFLVAVMLLVLAVVLQYPVSNAMRIRLAKQGLPLIEPLGSLDASRLGSYRVLERVVLEPTVVEALDTDQYLYWLIEDTSVPPGSPLRRGALFVTYYSGGPNLVPHTPDVCYLGAGYQPSRAHETVDLTVPSVAAANGPIPARVLTFAKTAVFDKRELSVVYTFFCNGRFAAGREQIRALINEPQNAYAFFSKVEASFPGATREQTLEGAAKLFDTVLPVLIADHWPDFDAAESAAGQTPRG